MPYIKRNYVNVIEDFSILCKEIHKNDRSNRYAGYYVSEFHFSSS